MSDQTDPAPTPRSETTHARPTFTQRALGAGHGPIGAIAVGVLSIAAGLLLGGSISSAHRHGYGNEVDLASLVRARQQSVLELEEQVDGLDQQLRELTDASLSSAQTPTPPVLSRMEVTGPGVEVELSDAAREFVPDEGTPANDLVVHQQDVDAVINALWHGEAEAIAVQGVRLSADTRVQCVGNVILVGTRSYAPPYRITAIGDPEKLLGALDADEEVAEYRRYASRYQMGWSATSLQSVTLPPAAEARRQGLALPLDQE